ncbi:hypothetical protein HPB49_022442 [Dermacentor silvarum]|uniref:Uncharacterized protein n=1 Tax=Dermacentor silvarum TaxID=543639 RepID=A0ACB8CBT1_DERSI|nr:hypothetical protein HPB49_022442 [Dermacentor silvarum]
MSPAMQSKKFMKAVFKEVKDGKQSRVFIQNDVDVPKLDKYSVLISVKACGLSNSDDKASTFLYKDQSRTKYPICHEVAGVVVEVGDWVTTVDRGDEVVGLIPLDYGQSGCAEYVRLNEYDVTKKPQNVSFVDAAGCIGDAVKAYTGLHYLGRLTSGDTVLVMDGASSFGAIAIQLAQHWGAKESAGLGIDLVLDNGVTQFAETSYRIVVEETCNHPVPSKHDIVSCLAVGGRWITSKSDLQAEHPSHSFFRGCPRRSREPYR